MLWVIKGMIISVLMVYLIYRGIFSSSLRVMFMMVVLRVKKIKVNEV